jgi:hypothetical protein
MNTEIMNDRTNHNRLAEQMAARLREHEAAVEHSVSQTAAFEAKASGEVPRKPRRVRPATETAEVAAPAMAVKPVVSALQSFNCEQNSREWQMARMGIPTASSFSDILAKGEGKTRRTYLMKLAGEIITGEPMENITTMAMERGHAMEAEARDLYALETGAGLVRAGFFRNGRTGCSPDSLIGDHGGLEVKTMAPHLLIDVILKDEFPPVHKAQVQGTLWIMGREWWDLTVYWPGMPRFVKRAYRDEAYIETLAAEVDRFNTDLDSIVAQMRQHIELSDAMPFAAAA